MSVVSWLEATKTLADLGDSGQELEKEGREKREGLAPSVYAGLCDIEGPGVREGGCRASGCEIT